MNNRVECQERPGVQPHSERPGVVTTPQQVLEGMRVGTADLRVICTDCDGDRGEGERVGAYAYRTADARAWDIARCYCTACVPEWVTTPTLGAEEVVVRGYLGVCSDVGTQTHWLCLVKVELVAFSPPTEGRSS